ESAIIIWDAAKKTQHFIRRASFETNTPNLGFLVPTPTRPELAEADDDAFKLLETATAPKVVEKVRERRRYRDRYGYKTKSEGPDMAAPGGGSVRTLGEEQRIAGFKAIILEADDPKALAEW